MILLQLFWSFVQIGLFSFGGGMAAIPLISDQVVVNHGWLTMTAFTDLVTISEMTPGPIAVNAATFVGLQLAGIPGALVATAGCILPACVIVSILAYLYQKYGDMEYIRGTLSGLRPAVIALIASAGLSILKLAIWGEGPAVLAADSINWVAILIFVAALAAMRKWKPNPILVMFGCGLAGGIIYTLTGAAV